MRNGNPKFYSRIFTSEPQVTRALAAEIRQDPISTSRFLSEELGLDLGHLNNVECERGDNEQADIMCFFTDAAGVEKRVAIEAKLDHEVTTEQLLREASVSEHLVLLVLDKDDAGQHGALVDAVITWPEVLEIFDHPRLTITDVEGAPDSKVQVERRFRRVLPRLQEKLGHEWGLEVIRGDGGMPSIVIRSPGAGVPQLIGQIQVSGLGMPPSLDDVKLQFYAGTPVSLSEDCFPSVASGHVPKWVRNVSRLYHEVLKEAPDLYRLRTTSAHAGKNPEYGKRKMQLVKEYLDDRKWLAHGYMTTSLGVRSVDLPLADLDEVVDASQRLFRVWFDCLEDE